jgi:hypothetical protein
LKRKFLIALAAVALLAVPSQARERGPILTRLFGPKHSAHSCQSCPSAQTAGPVRTALGNGFHAVGQAVQRPFGGCASGSCATGSCPR